MAKSTCMIIESKAKSKSASPLHIQMSENVINQVPYMKYLGLTIDETLSWDLHINNIVKLLSMKLSVLRRIRSFIKQDILVNIYLTTIQPIIDYGCTVWFSTTDTHIKKIQICQNYAARIVTNNFDYMSLNGETIVKYLGWQTVKERCIYFSSFMYYKAINGITPSHLTDSITMAAESHSRNTRLTDSMDVFLPAPKTGAGMKTFSFYGGKIWNSLPDTLRQSSDVFQFKKML